MKNYISLFIFVFITFFACDRPIPYQAPKSVDKNAHLKKTGSQFFSEYYNKIRQNRETNKSYPTNYRFKELEKSKRIRRQQALSRTILDWKELGPNNVGGRTRDIAVDPSDSTSKSWYAGTVGGGIWKTSNAGDSWENLTPNLPNLGTTNIEISAANPNVIYIGTGETYGGTLSLNGSGMWKSTDKGATFTQLASTDNPEFRNIMRMSVNPLNENEIVVATRISSHIDIEDDDIRSYIFKSIDGGATWSQKIATRSTVQQIITAPTDWNIQYASSNSNSILKSTDGGDTWSGIFDLLNNNIFRAEIAVSPTNPNVLYAAGETNNSGSVLHMTIDGGATWALINNSPNSPPFGDWLSGQGWYDNAIAVHPFDSSIVFVAGAGPMLSIKVNQGTPGIFTGVRSIVTDGYHEYPNSPGSKGVHVDHHNITLIPKNENTNLFYLLNTNDGGVSFSENSGQTFKQTGDLFSYDFDQNGEIFQYDVSYGYNVGQFYGIDKMNGGNRYVGGTQDNGSWISPTNPTENTSWESAPSGDGFEAAWHYQDSNLVLESSQFNSIYKSTDGGANWSMLNTPGQGPFLTRIANSKQDANLVAIYSNSGVLVSNNFGDSWAQSNMDNEWVFSNFSPLEISLATPDLLWTTDGHEKIFVSTNRGASFTKATSPNENVVTSFGTHPVNPLVAYALYSADGAGKIYQTNDAGQTWTDLTQFNNGVSGNGFPNVAVYSLLVMPFDTTNLWAGTDIGLFESTDNGTTWNYADNGIPPVSIYEMKIVNNQIILATHGRGVWSVDRTELEGYEPEPVLLSPLITGNNILPTQKAESQIALRSSYDSTRLTLRLSSDNSIVVDQLIAANAEPGTLDLKLTIPWDNFDLDELVDFELNAKAYLNGRAVQSNATLKIYHVDTIPDEVIDVDFEDDEIYFANLNFSVRTPLDFNSKGIHSMHPYKDNNQIAHSFYKTPIIVTDENLTFDEVAIIELGEPGVNDFRKSSFYDYVSIDTRPFNSSEWTSLLGYDSSTHNEWETIYNNGAAGKESDFKQRTINLSDYHNVGDTVYLRFNLFSDPLETGWGWAIDNLKLGTSTPTDNINNHLSINVYPNPTADFLTISSSEEVEKAQIYNINGQLVKEFKNVTNNIDLNSLLPGTYLISIFTEEGIATKKVIKL